MTLTARFRVAVAAAAVIATLPAIGAEIISITAGQQDAPVNFSLLTQLPVPGQLGGPQDPANFALHVAGTRPKHLTRREPM